MQPESTRASQNETLAAAQTTSPTHQHGLQPDHEEASLSLLSREDDSGFSGIAVETDVASVSSEGSRRARRSHSRRLSSSSNSQTSSPTNRIDEYERSQTYVRRPSERFTFQIVPSTKDSRSSISVQDFPNGTCNIVLPQTSPLMPIQRS